MQHRAPFIQESGGGASLDPCLLMKWFWWHINLAVFLEGALYSLGSRCEADKT